MSFDYNDCYSYPRIRNLFNFIDMDIAYIPGNLWHGLISGTMGVTAVSGPVFPFSHGDSTYYHSLGYGEKSYLIFV